MTTRPGKQRITPCLWFDGQAEQAAELYTRVFPRSRVVGESRYGKEGYEVHGQPEGQVMTVDMEFAGYRMMGLNGGPAFRINPAISFFVQLESEAEVDAVWEGLADGCSVLMPLGAYDWSAKYGWLSDRFGVSWQVSLGAAAAVGQTVTPSLLFVGAQQGRAEAAMEHYTSIFPNSHIEGVLRYDGSGADPAGTVQHAQFKLDGEVFMAMDSALAHDFGFNEGVSLIVGCETQDEVDHYWRALTSDGGSESMCGWLADRFGVSWQVVPEVVDRLLGDPDREAAGRVMQALLGMRKLNVSELEAAFRAA